MRTNNTRKSGFTLVEIMIVVAIIGLLAVIAIPNFVKARTTAQKNACINNLRQIDSAKQQWALENGKKSTDTPASTDLNPYIGRMNTGRDLYCPLSKSANAAWAGYSAGIGAVNTLPVCANYADPSHKASLDPTKQ